jgi:hypothetical protein
MFRRVLLIVVSLALFAAASHACSLCGVIISKATLAEEIDLAPIAVYGSLSNPRLNGTTGSVDLHIEKVLKDDGRLGQQRDVTLERYVPVQDPKQPPRYLVFLDASRGKFVPITGFPTKSPAVLEYLEGSKTPRKQGRVQALAYFAKHLGNADPLIATDAFLEFAKSNDADVGQAGKSLDPAFVRGLLGQRDLDSERLSMFAFLLGCCGQPADYALLAKIGNALEGDKAKALDGILAGCVNLQPKDGWQAIHGILADARRPLQTRLAAWRAIRFIHGWKYADHRADVLRGLELMVRDGDLADLGVEDLRRWKEWDLAKTVFDQFDRPTHKAPITRCAIIRYAISCPLPEARALVERARKVDPDYVDDQEKLLKDLESNK